MGPHHFSCACARCLSRRALSDTHGRIAALEARIEELSARAEQCRKINIAAKIALSAGLCAVLAPVVGLVPFGGAVWLVGFAAALAGIVLYGSNRSTLNTLLQQIGEHEALRTAMIDSLAPRLVEGGFVPRRLS